jgi:hypothetical protein
VNDDEYDASSVPLVSDGDLQHLWAARWERGHAAVLWRRIIQQRISTAATRGSGELPGPRATTESD